MSGHEWLHPSGRDWNVLWLWDNSHRSRTGPPALQEAVTLQQGPTEREATLSLAAEKPSQILASLVRGPVPMPGTRDPTLLTAPDFRTLLHTGRGALNLLGGTLGNSDPGQREGSHYRPDSHGQQRTRELGSWQGHHAATTQ